ncbi:hypothetical protein EDD15DRAFT_2362056 [Pisolithus albus]|nr:hypothetical protein EDD15DRAFT_2362056 [Pisolithus albus]
MRSPPAASDQTAGVVDAGVPNDTTVAQESTLARVESGKSTTGTVSKSVYSPSARASLKGSNAPDAPVEPRSIPLPDSANYATSLAPPFPVHGQDTTFLTPSEQSRSSFEETGSHSGQPTSDKNLGRFSFLSLPFLRSESKLLAQAERKSANRSQITLASARLPSVARNAGKKSRESKTFAIRSLRKGSTEKRVKESAMLVRLLIVCDSNLSPGAKSVKTSSVAKNAVRRMHSHLSKPKSASKVIAHLKYPSPQASDHPVNSHVPLRAVCLDVTDNEAHEQYFSKLGSVASASVTAVSDALRDVHIVHLFAAPNMGFGAPATSPGVFAGALLALGYATGKAIMPNHKGVIVPTDRVSVLTYWWGFEVCLPPSTLAYIQSAATPGSALLDLLTAVSVLNEGVREILPFIRYLAQFVQMEWHSIHATDEGRGVRAVLNMPRIMPIALVPRAWDFADLPQPSEQTQSNASHTPIATTNTNTPIAACLSTTLATPKASTDAVPRVSSAFSEISCDEDEVRPVISSEPPVLPELVVSSPASTEGVPEPVEGSSYVMSDEGQCHGSEAIVL